MRRVLLLTLALWACVSCARQSVAVQYPVRDISASTITTRVADTVFLGSIGEGETAVYKFSFRNTGEEPVSITSVETSCGCVELDYAHKPFGAGQTADCTLNYYSAGQRGDMIYEVRVKTSVSAEPYIFYVVVTVKSPAGL